MLGAPKIVDIRSSREVGRTVSSVEAGLVTIEFGSIRMKRRTSAMQDRHELEYVRVQDDSFSLGFR